MVAPPLTPAKRKVGDVDTTPEKDVKELQPNRQLAKMHDCFDTYATLSLLTAHFKPKWPQQDFQLSLAQMEQIHELSTRKVLCGNKQKLNYGRVPTAACKVCGAEKCKVKWGELRQTNKSAVHKVRGAVCYACIRATLTLHSNCRSYEVFCQVPGALDVWKSQSRVERAKLEAYEGDVCNCFKCEQARL